MTADNVSNFIEDDKIKKQYLTLDEIRKLRNIKWHIDQLKTAIQKTDATMVKVDVLICQDMDFLLETIRRLIY